MQRRFRRSSRSWRSSWACHEALQAKPRVASLCSRRRNEFGTACECQKVHHKNHYVHRRLAGHRLPTPFHPPGRAKLSEAPLGRRSNAKTPLRSPQQRPQAPHPKSKFLAALDRGKDAVRVVHDAFLSSDNRSVQFRVCFMARFPV
jgi:hypothetical protein